MPRYHSFLDVTVDTTSLDDTISEIELRLHELEGSPDWSALEGRVEELEAVLGDLKLQVQTLVSGAATNEDIFAIHKRLAELERYNMPSRMADMSDMLATMNGRVMYLEGGPKFSFMRWLRGLINA